MSPGPDECLRDWLGHGGSPISTDPRRIIACKGVTLTLPVGSVCFMLGMMLPPLPSLRIPLLSKMLCVAHVAALWHYFLWANLLSPLLIMMMMI